MLCADFKNKFDRNVFSDFNIIIFFITGKLKNSKRYKRDIKIKLHPTDN